MRRSLLLMAPLGLLIAACGEDSTSVGSGPRQRPTGPHDVVVQVLVDGGFVPAGVAVSTVPVVTVLGDGTVITPAPTVAIYPGPAIPPLQSTTISAGQVDALIRKAAELGLLTRSLDFGQPPIADAPDTTVTIVAGGTSYQHSANALIEAFPETGALPGITPEQAENRNALRAFVDATESLPPGDAEWVPEKVAVFDLGPYQADPELPQQPVEWPLAEPPATAPAGARFPCTLVEGEDADTLLQALSAANSLTPWVVDGERRSLGFRPVVPGDPGCSG